jgi:hypothetical protein
MHVPCNILPIHAFISQAPLRLQFSELNSSKFHLLLQVSYVPPISVTSSYQLNVKLGGGDWEVHLYLIFPVVVLVLSLISTYPSQQSQPIFNLCSYFRALPFNEPIYNILESNYHSQQRYICRKGILNIHCNNFLWNKFCC